MAQSHHPVARIAFSKSGASGLYHRARPTYPIEALNRILSHLPNRDAKVVELGAGTGILTGALLDHAREGQIQRWHALEPASGMREGFRRWSDEKAYRDLKLSCEDGRFDDMDSIQPHSADLVVVGQAWHWTGSDPEFQEKCLKEVERVLKPGGYFALIWNLKDREVADWVGKVRDAYEVHEAGTPQYRLGLWKTLFHTKTFENGFQLLPPTPSTHPSMAREIKKKNVDDLIDSSLPTLSIQSRVPLTLEGLQDRILSKSFITTLDGLGQRKLKAELEKVWKTQIVGNPESEWMDDQTVKFPYVTDLFILQKKAL